MPACLLPVCTLAAQLEPFCLSLLQQHRSLVCEALAHPNHEQPHWAATQQSLLHTAVYTWLQQPAIWCASQTV